MLTSGKRDKKDIGHTPFVIQIFNLQVSGKSTENISFPPYGKEGWQDNRMLSIIRQGVAVLKNGQGGVKLRGKC